jgi:hypothetical protein
MLNANLTSYQKGVHYALIKLFNNLPPNIKIVNYDIKVTNPAFYLTPSALEYFTSIENS